MKASLRTPCMLIGISVLLASSLAFADGWPKAASGHWSILANGLEGSLDITQLSGEANSQCQPIQGTIIINTSDTTDSIEGFYCPGSGRIAFVRYGGGDQGTEPKQFYSGNLSQEGSGLECNIGGYLAVFRHNGTTDGRTGFGSLGEYSFYAHKTGG